MMGGAGPGAADPAAAAAEPTGMQNLDAVIDKNQSFCLNQDSGHNMGNLFIGDERLYLQSDTDEQLLITINFKDTVNLEAISFGAPVDGEFIYVVR